MNELPTLFVSHGAPTLALEPDTTGPRLRSLASELPRPRAILVISAHWDTAVPCVGAAAQQKLIYDFSGFPEALYRLQYPAPGAPELAQRSRALLAEAGFAAELDAARGLDHGAWVPLLFMYPDASVPVTQLSVQSRLGPEYHYRLGRALSALRAKGVLIVGSGSFTHNLYEIGRNMTDALPAAYVEDFRAWMKSRLGAGDTEKLLEYREHAPHATRAHPTEEHLLPLFTALGAAGNQAPVQHVHQGTTYGVLAMDIFLFGNNNLRTAAPDLRRDGAGSSREKNKGVETCRK
jgi:4,5-DOPA dioxygenase extradiol